MATQNKDFFRSSVAPRGPMVRNEPKEQPAANNYSTQAPATNSTVPAQATNETDRVRISRNGLLALIIAVIIGAFALGNCLASAKSSDINSRATDTAVASASAVQPMVQPQNAAVPVVEAADVIKECWITDLDHLKKNGIYIHDSQTTNTGVKCKSCIEESTTNGEEEILYYLNGQYSRITGIWSITHAGRDYDYIDSYMEIYADDKLVYTSPTITAGDLPVNVDVNIRNCTILTIKLTDNSFLNSSAFFGNVKLYP